MPRLRRVSASFAYALTTVVAAPAALAQPFEPADGLFQPDDATASSEFSSSYDILQAIDGSGLDDGFSPYSVHDVYRPGNHWTTRSNATPATATFFFDSPVAMNAMVLWNHRSDGVASNPTYDVTRFDLTLRDAQQNVLRSFNDVAPQADTAGVAETFFFDPTDNVAEVEFVITSNQTLDNGATNSSFTGFGEIAFATGLAPVTLPGDYNDSGQVEQADLDLVLTNWGRNVNTVANGGQGIPAGWTQDRPWNLVDQDELDRVLTNWGGSIPPIFEGTAVPEPGLMSLLALAGTAVATRRRASA